MALAFMFSSKLFVVFVVSYCYLSMNQATGGDL